MMKIRYLSNGGRGFVCKSKTTFGKDTSLVFPMYFSSSVATNASEPQQTRNAPGGNFYQAGLPAPNCRLCCQETCLPCTYHQLATSNAPEPQQTGTDSFCQKDCLAPLPLICCQGVGNFIHALPTRVALFFDTCRRYLSPGPQQTGTDSFCQEDCLAPLPALLPWGGHDPNPELHLS